ncbi:hypothetical protein HT031_000163 [Scenedesmus sp. PABB004]|nr:hypothetical protein HT031_000163 [Scenedesmus sp. PABB004]
MPDTTILLAASEVMPGPGKDGKVLAEPGASAASKQQDGAEQDTVGEFAELPAPRSQRSILKVEGSLNSGDEERLKRTVSWHDFQGKELHTVREFVPSEHDDDELLCQPEEKGACCVIC